MRLAALLTLAVAASGCSTLDRFNDALCATGAFDLEPSSAVAAKASAVTVLSGDRRGRGVVTGKTTVLTVAHVAGDERDLEVGTPSGWIHARVVRRVPSSPEDLVELELITSSGFFGFEGFDGDRIAKTGSGEPSVVLASTGAHCWKHASALKPGDSGSPVLDACGAVVGLLVGKTRDGGAVVARLTSSGDTSPVLAARLAGQR